MSVAHWFQPLLSAVLLDPTELAPNASHQPLEDNYRLRWRPGRLMWFVQRTAVGRLLAYARQILWAFPKAFRALPSDVSSHVVVIALTTNQRTALEPVFAELHRRDMPTTMLLSKGSTPVGDVASDWTGLDALEARGWLLSIFFLPALLVRMVATRGYAGKSYSWALEEYWCAYGLYVACRRWLQHTRPAAVVLSNDHMRYPCTLQRAAQDQGIPTFYLQHACVTERFPPLRFDYALLDGRDALEKYAGAGDSQTTVYLIGIPRCDPYAQQQNYNPRLDRLGVCLSKADDMGRAEELLDAIAGPGLGLEVSVRPHPGSSRTVMQQVAAIAERLGLPISGKEEKAFDYIARHDAILAGVSAITLEAALLNVTPLQYELCPGNTDWYGFVPNGLCKSFDDIKGLLEELMRLRDDRGDTGNATAYYCETVGTELFGHSTELAAQLIEKVARGGSPNTAQWRRLRCAGTLVAYGLEERGPQREPLGRHETSL